MKLSLRGWLALLRSEWSALIWTLAVASNVLVGSAFSPPLFRFLFVVVGAYLITISTYVANERFDMKEDAINQPRRPLPSGRATPGDAVLLSAASAVIALYLAYMVNAMTLLLFSVSMALGLLYSLPGVRAKAKFPHKLLISWAGGFLAGMAGGAAINDLSPLILLLSLSWGTLVVVSVAVGDMADVRGDAANGIRTLPIVMGPAKAMKVIASLPVLYMLFISLAGIMDRSTPFFLFGEAPLAIYLLMQVLKINGKYEDAKYIRHIKQKVRTSLLLSLFCLIAATLPFIL